jgi:hypothetical protein
MLGVIVLALGLEPMFASIHESGAIDNRVMVAGYSWCDSDKTTAAAMAQVWLSDCRSSRRAALRRTGRSTRRKSGVSRTADLTARVYFSAACTAHWTIGFLRPRRGGRSCSQTARALSYVGSLAERSLPFNRSLRA